MASNQLQVKVGWPKEMVEPTIKPFHHLSSSNVCCCSQLHKNAREKCGYLFIYCNGIYIIATEWWIFSREGLRAHHTTAGRPFPLTGKANEMMKMCDETVRESGFGHTTRQVAHITLKEVCQINSAKFTLGAALGETDIQWDGMTRKDAELMNGVKIWSKTSHDYTNIKYVATHLL